MPRFAVQNFGCRATQADSVAIEHQLLARGFSASAGGHSADVVVLNTCTVTAAADSQARESIREIHRANPAARIIVTGCYAQRAPHELAELDGVSMVVGNAHQAEISGLASELLEPPKSGQQLILLSQLALATLPISNLRLAAGILAGDLLERKEVQVAPVESAGAERTRPTLKIQDGCNHRCTYCVIPSVRGHSRSLPADRVIEQVSRLVAAGAREVVLSGIDMGSYGKDLTPRTGLLALLESVLGETKIEQLRLSSVEPLDITRDLISLVASSDRLAPHFHVPLQSGADPVLRAMRRRYKAAHYERRAGLIRELLPHAAIGADVLAGFPGETDADHTATMELVRRVPFTYLHVFSFSARPGTAAAMLPGQVSAEVIRRRARELRQIGEEKKSAFWQAQAGRRTRALTLLPGRDATRSRAITGNYLGVRIADQLSANQWLELRIPALPELPADVL
jgi:threonylcarbamoyladenosine tRNA methylthiotransferase MtaB